MKSLLSHKIIFRVLLAVYILTGTIFCFLRPLPFWDMLPYMAATESLQATNTGTIHKNTYAAFDLHATPEMKSQMIDGHPFCKTMAADPKLFAEQLPFFRVKGFFVFYSWLVWQSGTDLFHAVLAGSLAGFVLLAFFLYVWLEKYLLPGIALLLMVVITLYNQQIFRIGSPDALATAFLVAGCFFLFELRWIIISSAFLVLYAATRPDNILFISLLLFLLFFLTKQKQLVFETNDNFLVRLLPEKKRAAHRRFFTGFLLCVAVTVFMTRWSGYSWWRMYYRSFVDLVVNPQSIDTHFNFPEYFLGMKKGITESMTKGSIYTLLALIAGFYLRKKIDLRSAEGVFVICIILMLIGKLFLHPLFENRYLFGWVDVLFVLLVNSSVSNSRANAKPLSR